MFGRVNVSGSMTNFNMSNFVPPSANAEDAFETIHMEGLESLYMTTVWSPCPATVTWIEIQMALWTATLVAVPRFRFKNTRCERRLKRVYPLLEFIIQITIRGEYIAKIGELKTLTLK